MGGDFRIWGKKDRIMFQRNQPRSAEEEAAAMNEDSFSEMIPQDVVYDSYRAQTLCLMIGRGGAYF